MTAVYLGSLSIGDVMPGAAAVGVAGVAGINASLPNLLSQLAGFQAWTPSAITISAQIGQLEAQIGALNAQLSLGVPPPSLATQLANLAAMIAALQGEIAGLNAQLALIIGFQAALGAAGVHLVAYEGPAGAFGAEVSAQITARVPPFDACHGLALLTTVPATWAALASILKATP